MCTRSWPTARRWRSGPAGPDDFGAVKAMHQAMCPADAYLRFFNLSRLAPEAEGAPNLPGSRTRSRRAAPHCPPVRWSACASFYVTTKRGEPRKRRQRSRTSAAATARRRSPLWWPTTCTIEGVATLLLEHLVSFAQQRAR